MKTVLQIISRSGLHSDIIVIEPQHIPRKGDRVDCKCVPAPIVLEVVWQYLENQIDISVIIE
jgi:hypothetical protein